MIVRISLHQLRRLHQHLNDNKNNKNLEVFDTDQIERAIVVVRGKQVLLNEQLASFYGVEIRHLVQQVKRNASRFPNDFMFQVTNEEWGSLKSQFVISKRKGSGGRRTPPYASTELGKQIQKIFGILQQLFNPSPPNHPSKPKSKIGFRSSNPR